MHTSLILTYYHKKERQRVRGRCERKRKKDSDNPFPDYLIVQRRGENMSYVTRVPERGVTVYVSDWKHGLPRRL